MSPLEPLARSAGLEARGARVLPMPACYRCDTWRVELEDGRAMLLRKRVNAHPGQGDREKALTDRVADLLDGQEFDGHRVVVPRILAVGEDGESLHEFFDGIQPHALEPSPATDEAMAVVGSLLRALHETPAEAWGMLGATGGPWPTDDWIGFVRWWFETTADNVPDVTARVARTTRELVPTVDAPRLIHGDAGPHNVLINLQRKRVALIDCESLMGGDPMLDVGTFVNQAAYRPDLASAFERGYFGPAGPTAAQVAARRCYEELHKLHIEKYHLHGGREPVAGG